MSVFDDIGDFFATVGNIAIDLITDPKNWVRAISLTGWPAFVADALPGVLSNAAHAAIVASPGLATGDNLFNAYVGEVVWRAKMYSAVHGFEKAHKMLTAGVGSLEQWAKDPDLGRLLSGVDSYVTSNPGVTDEDALRALGLMPEQLVEWCRRKVSGGPILTSASVEACRPDVLALATNAHLGRVAINTTRDYDVRSGERIEDLGKYYGLHDLPPTSQERRVRYLTAREKLGPEARTTMLLKVAYEGRLLEEEQERRSRTTAAELYEMWQRALRSGKLPQPIIDSLKRKYEVRLALEQAQEVPATGGPDVTTAPVVVPANTTAALFGPGGLLATRQPPTTLGRVATVGILGALTSPVWLPTVARAIGRS